MLPEKAIRALKWIVGILDENDIPYQISGGFAAKLYGSPRDLNDIDIDVPEEYLPHVSELTRDYIIDELARICDGKWDIDVMTLNYHGQEIDIGGAMLGRVSNKERSAWIAIPSDLTKSISMEVHGLPVNVVSPQDLIDYKQHLDGDHQVVDIEAAKSYLQKQSFQ